MTLAPPAIRVAIRKRASKAARAMTRLVNNRRRKVFGALGATLALALVGVLLTRSWVALLCAVVVLGAIHTFTLLELRRSQLAQRSLEAQLAKLERSQSLLALALYDKGRTRAPADGQRLPAVFAHGVGKVLLDRGDVLEAFALLSDAGLLGSLDRGVLRRLRNELRRRGYLARALEVARLVRDAPGADLDRPVRRTHRGRDCGVVGGVCADDPPGGSGVCVSAGSGFACGGEFVAAQAVGVHVADALHGGGAAGGGAGSACGDADGLRP